MLSRQFPTKNALRKSPSESENGMSPLNGMRSPNARQVMSPSVIGSKGMFSANKRKAVDIIREAIKRENEGEIESALRLCEDAALVFPEATIVAKVGQLRSKLRQQSKEKENTKKTMNNINGEKHHPPISSGSDIISNMLKKNTPKRTVNDKKPLKEVQSPSVVMIRSMTTLANKALSEKAAAANGEEEFPQEHFSFDEERDLEREKVIQVEAAPIAVATMPPVSREMVTNTLKKKVSEAINYQLLDILNNGSADELMGLHLIGKKRVQYIMELREEGFAFNSLDDLSMISFSPKTIHTFKELNIALAVGAF